MIYIADDPDTSLRTADLKSKEINGGKNSPGARRRLVAAVVPLMALSACSSQGGKPADSAQAAGAGQVASTPRIKIALITHAAPGDTFWDIVRKGAEEAVSERTMWTSFTHATPKPAARPSWSSRRSTRKWTASLSRLPHRMPSRTS